MKTRRAPIKWTDEQKADLKVIMDNCRKENGQISWKKAKVDYPDHMKRITEDAGRTLQNLHQYVSAMNKGTSHGKRKYAKRKGRNNETALIPTRREVQRILTEPYNLKPAQPLTLHVMFCPRCAANIGVVTAATGKMPDRCSCGVNLRAVKSAMYLED